MKKKSRSIQVKWLLTFALLLLMQISAIFAENCTCCGHSLNEKGKCPYEKQHKILINTIDCILSEDSWSSEGDQHHDDNLYDEVLSFCHPLEQSNTAIPNFISVNGGAIGQIPILQAASLKPYFRADDEFLPYQNTVKKEWKAMCKKANQYTENSQGFIDSWQQNYQFATNFLPSDMHFFLNAAVCLTKLGFLNKAFDLLQYALTIDEVNHDTGLSFAIKRQIAFIYGLKADWANALHTYRQIFPFGAEVGRFIDFITQAVDHVLSAGVLPDDEIETVKWWKYSLTAMMKPKKTK